MWFGEVPVLIRVKIGPKSTGFTGATDEFAKGGCHSLLILTSEKDLRTPPRFSELSKSRGFA